MGEGRYKRREIGIKEKVSELIHIYFLSLIL